MKGDENVVQNNMNDEPNLPEGWGEVKDPALRDAIAAWGVTWRPIETAPRDGTPILAYDPLADGIVVVWCIDGKWEVCWDAMPNPDCTHWMPLPAPPLTPE